jgi:hypothetical protein
LRIAGGAGRIAIDPLAGADAPQTAGGQREVEAPRAGRFSRMSRAPVVPRPSDATGSPSPNVPLMLRPERSVPGFFTLTRAFAHTDCPERRTRQGSVWQAAEHPSPLDRLPSSHCSPASTLESPQSGSCVQVGEQPSPVARLPSSHSSPGSVNALPDPAAQRRAAVAG